MIFDFLIKLLNIVIECRQINTMMRIIVGGIGGGKEMPMQIKVISISNSFSHKFLLLDNHQKNTENGDNKEGFSSKEVREMF